jgi:hypothetical protein
MNPNIPNFEGEPPVGDIKLEDHLPEAFKDVEVREATGASLKKFKAEHQGELPLKFRIEDFCFNRPEQVCTADTARKYIAWAGDDTETTRKVFEHLADIDTPVVLRSHPMAYGSASPVLQVTKPENITQHRRFLAGSEPSSVIQQGFFEKIDAGNTVVQLIKNAYPQRGLFLVRPTFIYDEGLREELRDYKDPSTQYLSGGVMRTEGMPAEFVGLRVLSLDEFAREKKDRLGGMFVFNPKTGMLEARAGFPYAAKEFIEGESMGKERGSLLGRTLDLSDSSTKLHHEGIARINKYDSRFLSQPDVAFLQKVLAWQMPRIAKFEDEIRQQEWIPQGLSTTHQFVVFPPQELGKDEINTQYFDFRAHESRAEMDELLKDRSFASLPTREKIEKFF